MKFFSRVVHYFLRTLFACAQFYYYHGGSVCLRQADKKTWRQILNIFRHLNIFRANFFRASITIGVTPRAKFVHGPRAALEDVQNVCHMSPQLGPPSGAELGKNAAIPRQMFGFCVIPNEADFERTGPGTRKIR